MHKTSGLRDPAAAFPLPGLRDDTRDRRQANRAVGVSALGLAGTGLIELLADLVELGSELVDAGLDLVDGGLRRRAGAGRGDHEAAGRS